MGCSTGGTPRVCKGSSVLPHGELNGAPLLHSSRALKKYLVASWREVITTLGPARTCREPAVKGREVQVSSPSFWYCSSKPLKTQSPAAPALKDTSIEVVDTDVLRSS